MAVRITKKNNIENIINFDKNDYTNLKLLHIWEQDNEKIILLGLKKGKENNINHHELPKPVDNILYYGDLIVYKVKKNKIVKFNNLDYKKWWEEQFGGFEDLDDTIIEDELLEDDTEDDYDYDDSFIASEDD